MTLDQFRQLAEAWGGDIDRWPAETQRAARDLATGAAGAAILAEHAELDELFAAPPQVDPARSAAAGFAVLQRIAATAARPMPWYRRWMQPASLMQAGSLACSALLGVWMAGLLPYHQSQDALTVVGMVFDSSALTLWGAQ